MRLVVGADGAPPPAVGGGARLHVRRQPARRADAGCGARGGAGRPWSPFGGHPAAPEPAQRWARPRSCSFWGRIRHAPWWACPGWEPRSWQARRGGGGGNTGGRRDRRGRCNEVLVAAENSFGASRTCTPRHRPGSRVHLNTTRPRVGAAPPSGAGDHPAATCAAAQGAWAEGWVMGSPTCLFYLALGPPRTGHELHQPGPSARCPGSCPPKASRGSPGRRWREDDARSPPPRSRQPGGSPKRPLSTLGRFRSPSAGEGDVRLASTDPAMKPIAPSHRSSSSYR